MTTIYKNDMAIIVSSPDSYSDVFDVFIELFNKNWPDCKYEIILSNNSKHCNYANVTVVNSGEDAIWSDRVLKAIKKCNTKYILTITDDSLVSSSVDTGEIEKILQIMKYNNLKYYRLYTSPQITAKVFKNMNHIHHISKQQAYGLNLMAAIWETNYFVESFGRGQYSGWDIEGKWLEETIDAPDENIEGCVADDRDILHIIHGVNKGKWIPSSIRKLKKSGYNIDVGIRGEISMAQEIVIQLKRTLTNQLSPQSRRKMKVILSKLGVRFSTRY